MGVWLCDIVAFCRKFGCFGWGGWLGGWFGGKLSSYDGLRILLAEGVGDARVKA